MMSDSKKLNEEQLKNVAGGAGSDYDPDQEWIVHGSETRKNGSRWSGYEKDGEWIPSDN